MSWAVPNTRLFGVEFFEYTLKMMQNQRMTFDDFQATYEAIKLARSSSADVSARSDSVPVPPPNTSPDPVASERGCNWKALWAEIVVDNNTVMEHIIEICRKLVLLFMLSLTSMCSGHDERVWDRTKGTYAENFARALVRVNSMLGGAQTTMRVNGRNTTVRGPEISGLLSFDPISLDVSCILACSLQRIVNEEQSKFEGSLIKDSPTGAGADIVGGTQAERDQRRFLLDLVAMKKE